MPRRLLTAGTVGQTIFWWAMLLVVFGGIAGLFINFVPAGDLALPVLLVALGLAGALTMLWLVAVTKAGTMSGAKTFVVALGCFGALAGFFFLLLDVTVPAYLTEWFGHRYEASDKVVSIKACRGRRCRFCDLELRLEKHDTVFAPLCLAEGQAPGIKAGDHVRMVVYRSPMGVWIKSIGD